VSGGNAAVVVAGKPSHSCGGAGDEKVAGVCGTKLEIPCQPPTAVTKQHKIGRSRGRPGKGRLLSAEAEAYVPQVVEPPSWNTALPEHLGVDVFLCIDFKTTSKGKEECGKQSAFKVLSKATGIPVVRCPTLVCVLFSASLVL
jgi:hypothetical protein